MILDVFVIAFIISLITGRIKDVLNRNYKLLILFPVPFVLQIIPGPRFWMMLISFAILIYLLIVNRHIPGFKFLACGMAMNAFIMLINGGRMPVLQSLASSMELHIGSRHLSSSWQYWGMIFGDWIPVILPWGRRFIISIGDILVYIGIFLLFLAKGREEIQGAS